MVFDEIPISSASIIANSDHLTMSNQRSSPWRTAGPSGSLEMISGRMMWSAALGAREPRVDTRPETSVVNTSQRPAK
ncbi:hypothetical protein D3C83_91490 [compost metagenome]